MLGCDRRYAGLSEHLSTWTQSPEISPSQSPFTLAAEPTEPLIHRILSLLESNVKEDPSRLAVIEGMNPEKRLTCGELRRRVLATASFLRSCGFRRGDRAATAVTNTIEFPIFHLAVWAAGGIVVGSSVAFKAHETQYQLVDSSPKIVLTTEEYLPTIMDVLDNCPSVKTVCCIRSTAIDLADGVIDFSNAINHSIDVATPEAHLDDVAMIYYTSGTTGLKKGVLHTHRALHTEMEAVRSHWRNEIYPVLGMDDWDIMHDYQLIATANYHILGFILINTCLISGSPLVLLNVFQDGTLLKCVERYKPSFLNLHPAMIMQLTKEKSADLSSVKVISEKFKMVISGGSYLRESVANEFLNRFPNIEYLVQRYGLTEIPLCHLPILYHRGFNSSVGVAVSVCQRKVVNVETNEPCKEGEMGEVMLNSPTQTIGYLNRPESTEELFDSDGWIRTGDIGYVDALGQLHLVERIKELMKINHKNGTFQVSPSEIEDAILTCSKVGDVGVVGIPDEERELLLRAYVVKAGNSLTAEEVEKVVSDKLASYKFITGGVRFIEKMPRSSIGKMMRRELLSLSQME